MNKSISYQLVSDTSNCIWEQNTLSGGEGAFLSIDQILYRIFEALHLAQQPKGQLRQPEWADKERNHQQNQAVLWGVCHQHSHAQQGNHRTEQPQHQAGYIDYSRCL